MNELTGLSVSALFPLFATSERYQALIITTRTSSPRNGQALFNSLDPNQSHMAMPDWHAVVNILPTRYNKAKA